MALRFDCVVAAGVALEAITVNELARVAEGVWGRSPSASSVEDRCEQVRLAVRRRTAVLREQRARVVVVCAASGGPR